MDWKEHITSDPKIAHGQSVIKNTRIPVSVVLDNLAAGLTPEEITEAYPPLTRENIQAAVAYAAELARERTFSFP